MHITEKNLKILIRVYNILTYGTGITSFLYSIILTLYFSNIRDSVRVVRPTDGRPTVTPETLRDALDAGARRNIHCVTTA